MGVFTDTPSSMEGLFNNYLASFQEPIYVTNFRKVAFEKLKVLGFPDRSMEQFRKISLSNFQPEVFLQSLKPTSLPTVNDTRLSFTDFSTTDETFLSETLQTLLKKYESSYFALLNFSFFTSGTLVEIPKEYHSTLPISLAYSQPTGLATLPLTIVRAGVFTSNIISIKMASTVSDETCLVNYFTYISANESAKVHLINLEDFSSSAFHFATLHTTQDRDSELTIHHINLNGLKGKTFIDSELNESGASLKTMGITATTKREFQDLEITNKHLSGHTHSFLDFKTVAKDRSHHVFTGNLVIPITSKKVETRQINQNLLLNKTARTESIPKLEVYAEDVQCSHGATVGEIDEEQLFFLQARGLTQEEAKALIVEGFLASILDQIPAREIADEVLVRLQNKLGIR
jgi:uncharacterized protein